MMKSGTLLVIALVLISLFVGGTGAWSAYMGMRGPLPQDKLVTIPSGVGVNKIADILHSENVIAHPLSFKLTTRLMGLGGSLKAGTYDFNAGLSLKGVIGKISTGDVHRFQFTVPEGQTVAQVREMLMNMEDLTGDVPQVDEGFLLPETYSYEKGMSRAEIVEVMKQKAEQALANAWRDRVVDLPLKDPLELLTLASIIEKETSLDEERRAVAGVYINRLKKGMKLQADPTVIYGASNYTGNLQRKHLQEDQPYNTYVHKGLPPTPIANPGVASIQAAANPEEHDYLFFVADGKGGHTFAKTYQQHKKNVRDFLQVLRSNR